jgi:5'(3')-deoxyribonucleotidase
VRIGLDMDGVVYDYVGNLSNIIVAEGGDPIPEDCGWFKPVELWPPYFDHPERVFLDGDPIPGAVEGCRDLKLLCDDLWIITAAWKEAGEPKIKWLEKHGIEYDNFVLTGLDHTSQPKSAIKCDLYIDDGAHNILELYENTFVDLIIFEQSWNKTQEMYDLEESSDRVTRVRNWEEMVNLVEGEVKV